MEKAIILSGASTTFPVARQMGKNLNIIIAVPEVAQQLLMLEVPNISLQRWMDDNVQSVAASEAAMAMPSVGFPSEEALGLPPGSVAAWFPGYIYSSIHRQVSLLITMERAAQEYDIRGVVVHEDVTETFKVMCQWARSKGIPAIHIPHATYHDVARGPIGTDPHDLVTATHILTAGGFQTDWYAKRGAENVTSIGCPLWDKWAVLVPDKLWARKALRLRPESLVAVYLSAWHQQTTIHGDFRTIEQAARFVMQALGQAEGVDLVLKVHPSANKNDELAYVKMAQQEKARCLVTRLYLDLLLQAADICIAYGPSNALIEGVLMNCPGIAVGEYGAYSGNKCVSNVGIGGDLWGEIQRQKELAVSPRWREAKRRFVKEFAHKNDGGATQRAIERVVELCSL